MEPETPNFLNAFHKKLGGNTLDATVDSDDDDGEVKRRPTESLFKRLMTTKKIIPLYALATNHMGMQKV